MIWACVPYIRILIDAVVKRTDIIAMDSNAKGKRKPKLTLDAVMAKICV